MTDASDRQSQIDEPLRSSEERLRFLVDSIEDYGIFMLDPAGRVVSWNIGAEKMKRYAAHEIIGRHFSCFYPEEDVAAGKPAMELRTAAAEGRFEDLGWRVRKDGTRFWANVVITASRAHDGTLVGFAKITRDMTQDRKHEQDRLRLSEERFKSVFNCVSDGIFIVDAKTGRFIEVNEPGAGMHGYSRDELIGASIETISAGVAPYTQREAVAAHERAMTTGRSQDFDWRSKCKDGRLFWSAVTLRFASISDQDVILWIVRDVTERRAVEDQLRQAQKMEAVGQLTGGVAHDFNNLLAVMQGNLELLEDLGLGDPTAVELVADALDAARRGASLTHRLLAFSRQQQLAPSAVKAGTLVTGLIGVLRRVVEESVRIETVIAPNLWTSRIDAHQLENALLNLALNARDAMPDGGKLTIAAENAILDEEYARDYAEVTPGRYVLLSVSDTGTGMPKEVVARAFEPFFTTKPVGQGTGLGLPMVYGFVKQSGGHAAIYSEPGIGTTVKLFLPEFVAEPAAASTAAKKPAPAADGEAVVLVVEDDEMVRRLQLRMLASLHYRTLEAADGPAGLAILESDTRVDLLLTDIVLPGGMSGPALVDLARRRRPDLKVIFVSGYAPATIKERYDLSSAHVLGKPCTRSDLAHALQEVLKGATAR